MERERSAREFKSMMQSSRKNESFSLYQGKAKFSKEDSVRFLPELIKQIKSEVFSGGKNLPENYKNSAQSLERPKRIASSTSFHDESSPELLRKFYSNAEKYAEIESITDLLKKSSNRKFKSSSRAKLDMQAGSLT